MNTMQPTQQTKKIVVTERSRWAVYFLLVLGFLFLYMVITGFPFESQSARGGIWGVFMVLLVNFRWVLIYPRIEIEGHQLTLYPQWPLKKNTVYDLAQVEEMTYLPDRSVVLSFHGQTESLVLHPKLWRGNPDPVMAHIKAVVSEECAVTTRKPGAGRKILLGLWIFLLVWSAAFLGFPALFQPSASESLPPEPISVPFLLPQSDTASGHVTVVENRVTPILGNTVGKVLIAAWCLLFLASAFLIYSESYQGSNA